MIEVKIIIGLLILAVACFIIAGILSLVDGRKQEQEKNDLIIHIDNAITESGLVVDSWDEIKLVCSNSNLAYVKDVAKRINRLLTFTLKYQNVLSETDLEKLIDGEYFVGMTEEMVLESFGEPDKIEIEELKTKTKKIFIYGNKTSGDVLVFENGKLARFKDR
jgi:hypothetical protein